VQEWELTRHSVRTPPQLDRRTVGQQVGKTEEKRQRGGRAEVDRCRGRQVDSWWDRQRGGHQDKTVGGRGRSGHRHTGEA